MFVYRNLLTNPGHVCGEPKKKKSKLSEKCRFLMCVSNDFGFFWQIVGVPTFWVSCCNLTLSIYDQKPCLYTEICIPTLEIYVTSKKVN